MELKARVNCVIRENETTGDKYLVIDNVTIKINTAQFVVLTEIFKEEEEKLKRNYKVWVSNGPLAVIPVNKEVTQ